MKCKLSVFSLVLLLAGAVFSETNLPSGNAGLLLVLFGRPLTLAEQQAYSFFQKLDLSVPELSDVKTLYNARQYVQALDRWRDQVMADLRAAPMGEFGWHSAKTIGYQVRFADQLVGAMTEAEYIAYCISIDRLSAAYYDEWGLSGVPGTVSNANWLAVPAADFSADEMASFKMFIPLTVRYWQYGSSSNQVFASKWFEIVSDFSRSCYDAINPLSLADKRTNYPNLAWNTDAGSALHQAWRVENIFKSIAVLAKAVSGGTKASSWMDSLDARADIPANGAYTNFPAQPLADIAVSLVEDHSIALTNRYLIAGAVPNQRFSGLYALLLTSRFFNEFRQTQSSIETQADAAMLDFVSTMVHPDGGMLEQSLNYNEGDANRMEELLGIFGADSRNWSGLMRTDIDSFWRMVWALRGPTFSPPQIGNASCDIAPEVWTNTAVKSKWISSQTNNYHATGSLEKQINDGYAGTGSAPVFTSVAFPYAGYYMQRSGWTLDDMSLFFMGGRPQRGHFMCDKNAIQLSAFGRDLLVAAGPPNYKPDTAPTVADAYLSEQSSLKVNTILVDGNNQNKTNKLIVLAQQVYTNTINAIWHSTEYFDAVEGLHEQGYGSETNVTHHRQSFFVKEAGLWVLIDNLLSSDADSHSYRQVWHFQPYKTNDGTKVYGFKEAEVVIDQTNHCIYTADNDTTNTPNVHLYSFGENVTFEKYYGSTNPVYGWYARGIGDCIPAVDVHAVFSGSSNLQLVTLIRPIQGLANGITGLSDLSSGITNGFDCATGSGASLSVRSTLQSNATLTAVGISAQAKILLVTTTGGTKRGIVMKAGIFSAGAVNADGLAGRSFEFKVESNGVVMAKNILVPQGFQWSGNSGAMFPDYGNGSNDWYNISP
jgi:hypothetical protein